MDDLPPGDWSLIKSLEDITVQVDDGQESSSIYGNGRNCIAVTVSFNCYNVLGNIVDMGRKLMKPYVYLVNYGTGRILNWCQTGEPEPGQIGLFYAPLKGRYCSSTIGDSYSRMRAAEGSPRANITYFLYAVCRNRTTYDIGALIKLGDGTIITTARGSPNPCKASLLVKRPMRYHNSDLEPYLWVKVYHERDVMQWVAHVTLKRSFHSGWVFCDIEGADNKDGELYYVARTTRNRSSWFIYLAPLGKQRTQLATLAGRFRIEYNLQHESFSVICVKVNNTTFSEVDSSYDNPIIRLLDSHGNIGVFKLNYTDPTNPTVIAQNP